VWLEFVPFPLERLLLVIISLKFYGCSGVVQWRRNTGPSFIVTSKILINWCLMPAIAIFQLYPGNILSRQQGVIRHLKASDPNSLLPVSQFSTRHSIYIVFVSCFPIKLMGNVNIKAYCLFLWIFSEREKLFISHWESYFIVMFRKFTINKGMHCCITFIWQKYWSWKWNYCLWNKMGMVTNNKQVCKKNNNRIKQKNVEKKNQIFWRIFSLFLVWYKNISGLIVTNIFLFTRMMQTKKLNIKEKKICQCL
jgi:hypothetical protein